MGASSFEALEQRQLLFALTIQPDSVNPASGLGRAEVTFGYTLPYLFTELPAADGGMPETVVEEFADEMDQWTTANPPVPPNGTTFNTSEFRISYRAQAQNAVQLLYPTGPTAVPGVADLGAQGASDRDLGLQLVGNDQVTFTFTRGGMQGQGGTPRPSTNVQFTVRSEPGRAGVYTSDGDGLRTTANGTRVELLRNGIVVQTLTGAQLAATATTFDPTTVGFQINFNSGFDSFRFSAANQNDTGAYADNFIIDDITTTFPSTRFGDFVSGHIVGATVVFIGPAGATARFLDLYGREMIATTNLGVPDGADGNPDVDANGDGIPDFNDGIGRIEITGANANSAITIVGGDFQDPQFYPTGPEGFLDSLEGLGFGYDLTNDNPPSVIGLPDLNGSVVIGSPYVRNRQNTNTYLAQPAVPPANQLFLNPDQGIFVRGSSFGSVQIHGIVHGSSAFEGSLDRYNASVQLGSVSVAGDLGQFIIASDAGYWESDDADFTRSVGASLTVGRTVREIVVAGRNSMNIQVLADINNPARPSLSFLNYNEREVVYGFDPATVDGPRVTLVTSTLRNGTGNWNDRTRSLGQAAFYGSGYFRNDALTSAEFIGYNGTAVRVRGALGGADPVNNAIDIADVFAFAADPTREVVIEADTVRFDYVRIVDRNGIPIAASDAGAAGRGPGGNTGGSAVLRFRPDHADVYYLVLNARPSDFNIDFGYDFLLSGMAPTTVGAVTSGAGTGSMIFTLNSGSVGAIRPGVGFLDGGNGQNSPNVAINSTLNDDDLMQWGNASISIPGNLYSIFAGGDIKGATVLVGRDFGTLVTGRSPIVGLNADEGDLSVFNLRVGRNIGILDITGGLGVDQDPEGNADERGLAVGIRSGTAGGQGNIGQILVGSYVSGTAVAVTTSSNSTLDQFIVRGNLVGFPGGDFVTTPGEIWDGTPIFTLGGGSDVRFVDFGLIQDDINSDVNRQLNYNQSLEFVDDAGATFTISISGGTALGNASRAEIRSLPINGSEGVAVGRINVRLEAGASLFITATGAGSSGDAGATISIGRIVVNVIAAGGVAPPAANQIVISDAPGVIAEIDVGLIEIVGALANITNSTVGRNLRAGDIVAIDAGGLSTITVSGSLGRTQTNGAGSPLLGPFLGIGMAGDAVRGPIPVDPAAESGDRLGSEGADWDTAQILNPILLTDYMAPSPLEDLGSPVDFTLNGVIVRGGDLVSVRAGGAIGDVILANGHLLSVVANSDGVRPFGAFEGIVGTLYADVINTVDVGDGLLGTGPGPFAQAGIFANEEIISVTATRVPNAVIRGTIVAADIDNAPRTQVGTANPVNIGAAVAGFGSLIVSNGIVDGLLLHSMSIESWWSSLRVRDVVQYRGDINAVTLTNTTLFRSELQANLVNTVSITGGAYDATSIQAVENIALVTADDYRNTTILGEPGEFHANSIRATRNLGSVITNGLINDMADLFIGVSGIVNGRIAAGNLIRVDINVANIINQISATTDAKSVTVVSGRVRTFNVGRNIRQTSLTIAGPLENMTAGGEITGLVVRSSGPDGRIGTIRAIGRITGDFQTSGPITTIESVNSDISGTIVGTDVDVNVGTLRAGRDVLIDLQIPGNANSIIAGRNVGRAIDGNDRALDIRGNLGSVTAGGQIFSDLLIGQSITGTITNGRSVGKPGNDQVGFGDIIAFGRINSLSFNGDFNGNISSLSGGIGTITITNGSFRQGKLIKALDGSIGTISIIGGDLLGDIFTDGSIGRIELLTGADGFRSQIGLSNTKLNSTSVDAFRNQLPPDTNKTANRDGPRITAGQDIESIFLQSGTIWESVISAGRVIRDITINGGGFRSDRFTSATSSFVIAGDRIERVSASNNSDRVAFIAGITGLGEDDAVGGLGGAADVVKEGSIGSINLRGNRNRSIIVAAGINAGGDGLYNTGDEVRASGISNITSVQLNGARTSSVFADGSIGSTSGGPGLTVRSDGSGLSPAEPARYSLRTSGAVELSPGVIFSFSTPTNQRGTLLFTGPGRAFFDSALNRVILSGTTSASSLTVQGRRNGRDNSNANLLDFNILGNNNAEIGSLNVRARLQGDSNIFVDGGINSLFINRANTSGIIGAGGDIASFTVATYDAGNALGRIVGLFQVNSNFGRIAVLNEASASFLDLTTLSIRNAVAGAISSDYDIDTVTVGSINTGGIRSGGTIGPVTANTLNVATISARDAIGTINIAGEVRDSSISSGVDLGRDAAFGGTGLNSDIVSNGTIGPINIAGAFPESDISAGVYRGPDGFLGTADDRASDGRSAIGLVTIGGQAVGSNINSEQYRIISTGSINNVLVAGSDLEFRGNFAVRQLGALPVPVTVTDLNIFEDSRIYRAQFSFNQPIDASTFAAALSIAEVRNNGATIIGLAEGISADYTVRFDSNTNIGTITFSRNVTDRNLPQQLGVPAAGVFRFILSGTIFRGASQGVMLDGNGDGTTGDDFSEDGIVGDAGDKIVSGNPTSLPTIDFYAASDLNLLLDSNYNSDNNPDVNTTYTLRGTIGDHPDANADTFRIGSDVDLYRITLRAGQVLKLGQIGGVAQGAFRAVFDATGNIIASNSSAGPGLVTSALFTSLPANLSNDVTATSEVQYLVNQTGTYIIAVSGSDPEALDIASDDSVPNAIPVAGAIGAYSFTVQVFDDGNTGFNGDTDSGNGSSVVNAPLPLEFAGSDGQFGTVDDVSVFNTGRFSFTLDRGPDGRPNTADDIVSGSDDGEIVSSRRSGSDGQWGTTDDVVRAVVSGAIGLPGGAGVPNEIAPDADVYRLNNGQPIAPGTRIRLTFRLTDTGGTIGLSSGLGANVGNVQIAVFETPSDTGFADAKLVASPSEFLPIGGQTPRSSSDGNNSYGYDSAGDFFMELVLPGSLDNTGINVPAAYAAYVQGSLRSDYTLEILTQGTGSITRSSQNVLIETRGGFVDWLETSGLVTNIDAFTTSVLGFAGQINGIDVDDYVLAAVINSLNDLFAAANVNIVISNDASTFEGQDFSTVFLAGNTEPSVFFNNESYGVSEHVDMLNIDKNDQAVVFLPSLALLGNDPSQPGIDNLSRALTAAVGRRIGELIGLRITNPTGSNSSPVSIMASDSVTNNPGIGGVYGFTNTNSVLSGLLDFSDSTNFFLGNQNSLQLLQRILAPRA